MNASAISVVIPVRNEGTRIRTTVETLLSGRSHAFPLEIVIVDDASSDGACDSLEALAEAHPRVSIVVRRLARWSGIPFARNHGARLATHPVLVITDGNTEFPRGWNLAITEHLRAGRILCATIADRESVFRGYGCQLLLPSMSVTWIPVPNAYGGQVPIAPCTCSIVERTLFLRLGGYDESLPIYGAAEPEFSVRAWLSGCEIVQVPELVVRHYFRPRAQFDEYLAALRPIMIRNYLRFACCYLPLPLLREAYAYYGGGNPAAVTECVERLVAEGVWLRRAQLATLPRTFDWLVEHFDLRRMRAAA